MTNVLYFEGAGMNFYSEEQTNFSDVGNFRIRTAFKNLNGVEYYIEMGSCPRYDKKGKVETSWGLRIDHLFKIEDRHKEELSTGDYEIKKDWQEIRKLDYTTEHITKWINENLNCNFDTIEVLDSFQGYRVHADNGGYNLIENADINHERASRRKAAYEKIDMEYRKALNEKYSKISLIDMSDNSLTIRCYASEQAIGNLPRVQTISI